MHQVQIGNASNAYHSVVQGRKVIYLDHNFWIDLTDERSSLARECRLACLEAVDAGLAIFPVSLAELHEVQGVEKETSRRNMAELMESLSLNIAMRSIDELISQEAWGSAMVLTGTRDLVAVKEAIRQRAFVGVHAFAGDQVLRYDGISQGGALELADMLRRAVTVTWVVSHHPTRDFSDQIAKFLDHFNRPLVGMPPLRARHKEERRNALQAQVFPVWRAMVSPHEMLGQPLQWKSGSLEYEIQNVLEKPSKAFSVMPELDSWASCMASINYNRQRKVVWSDFWDIEHITASTYADAFVCQDLFVGDMLSRIQGRPRLVQTLSGLVDFLKLFRE